MLDLAISPPSAPASSSTSSVRARILTEESQLESLSSRWADLVSSCPWRNPCLEPEFLIPMFSALGNPSTQLVVVESHAPQQAGELIGLMPICEQKFYRLPIRCAASWRPDEAFDSTPLLKSGKTHDALEAIFDCLSQSGFRMLSFETLSADPKLTAVLDDVIAARGLGVFQRDQFQRAALCPEGNVEDYLQKTLSKNRRKKARRAINQLEQIGEVRFEHTTSESDFSQWAQEFVDLEASGWKGRQGTAIASRDSTLRFFHDTVIRFAQRDGVRFGKLSVDQQSIAMLVDFISGHHRSAFKTTYDERFAEYSPGTLLEIQNIRWIYESDCLVCDSCTAPDNELINSLYSERLGFQDLVVSLDSSMNFCVQNLLPFLQRTAQRIRSLRN